MDECLIKKKKFKKDPYSLEVAEIIVKKEIT